MITKKIKQGFDSDFDETDKTHLQAIKLERTSNLFFEILTLKQKETN